VDEMKARGRRLVNEIPPLEAYLRLAGTGETTLYIKY
jgi:hypothetical protein